MPPKKASLARRLELVERILQTALFCPLHLHDWLGYCFGQPALTGLEEEEVFDLFVRAAIAAETVQPETGPGRAPLAWLWSLEEPGAVLSQVLADLRQDRPYLFHRVLFSLPSVAGGLVNPDDFELAEDFLAQALGRGADMTEAAAQELDILRRRGLKAAGQDPERPHPRLAGLAEQALEESLAAGLETDGELLAWLAGPQSPAGRDPELGPAVMVEAWTRWVGAVTGAQPDLGLLSRLLPGLGLDALELASYLSPGPGSGHVIEAQCPFCGQKNALRLASQVKELARCPHLVFVGSGDEAHLMDVLVLGGFSLGEDFRDLLDSYYQSPADLELFATIVNDLYEMLRHQGRVEARPVECPQAPKAFYNLRAYFSGPPLEQSTHH